MLTLRMAVMAVVLAFLAAGCNGSSSNTQQTNLLPSDGDGGSLDNTRPQINGVTATFRNYSTAGNPFQALVTGSGEVLVSVSNNGTPGSGTGVQVFSPVNGILKSACLQLLPASLGATGANGMSFFPGGTDIALAAEPNAAAFYHTADLLGCGTLPGYHLYQGTDKTDSSPGTFDVNVTPDGTYAFVANEYGVAPGATLEGNVGVARIVKDASGKVSTGTQLIGKIATGGSTIPGITLSPDGTRLYVFSESNKKEIQAAGSSNKILFKNDCVQSNPSNPTPNGLLTVIDVATAVTSPGPKAILKTVHAGCSPVRGAVTRDGKTIWVAARGDNRVLAFDTRLLESDPDNALIGYAATGGIAPVGIALFHNDQLLAVANSNRFPTPVNDGNATILNVTSPASAKVMTTIQTGKFPRNITVDPDGSTLYLTNYRSNMLQVIKTTVK